MKITSKYIVVPVNPQVEGKNVLFYDRDGRLVFDFSAKVDAVTTKFLMYYNMERFRGMELTVATEPEMDIEFPQVDERPMDVYHSYFRPTVHFTAAYGWLNDPNGLVYHDGTYHLFFQHNPVGMGWGNMHWGHATSTDLIHWTEHDLAIFPDERGIAASGSGFVDTKNVSGLSPDGNTILLYYTREGGIVTKLAMEKGEKFHQYLAYSTDGGETFADYGQNPVLTWQTGYNRDPKVIWSEELGVYLLVLYMDASGHMDENEYRFYESDDLVNWKYLQTLILPDDCECPNLFLCNVENEPGEKRWVFAGAHDIYCVGHFDGESRQFVVDSDSKTFYHHKDGKQRSYAAQTFAGIPDRAVKMAWLTPYVSGTQFTGVMSIPCEMTLVKRNGEYYLKGLPVRELDTLVRHTETRHGSDPIRLSKHHAHDITVTAPRDSRDFTIRFFDLSFEVKCSDNTFRFGDTVAPLSYTGGDVSIRMIVDTVTVEIYLDEGLIYTVEGDMFDRNLNRLTVSYPDAKITVKELEGIHG